jgi:hypothetical protein
VTIKTLPEWFVKKKNAHLGKSGKVFGIKIAQNPLFLEGNHNFACW